MNWIMTSSSWQCLIRSLSSAWTNRHSKMRGWRLWVREILQLSCHVFVQQHFTNTLAFIWRGAFCPNAAMSLEEILIRDSYALCKRCIQYNQDTEALNESLLIMNPRKNTVYSLWEEEVFYHVSHFHRNGLIITPVQMKAPLKATGLF